MGLALTFVLVKATLNIWQVRHALVGCGPGGLSQKLGPPL